MRLNNGVCFVPSISHGMGYMLQIEVDLPRVDLISQNYQLSVIFKVNIKNICI